MIIKKSTTLFLIAFAVIIFLVTRNNPPVAHNDSIQTKNSIAVSIPVLNNDIDKDGDTIKVDSVTRPTHGTTSIVGENTILYTPEKSFFGTDSFTYSIIDDEGGKSNAKVSVKVIYTPPKFHDRENPSSLSEMMQEPPTTMYGSTIDVFQYEDELGKTREITIAGHADSQTCGDTSGVFAGALLYAKPTKGDFFLAGSGRMAIPPIDHKKRTELLRKESVKKYEAFLNKLEISRFFVNMNLKTQEDAEKDLEMSFESAQDHLDTLAEHPDVQLYLDLDRPAAAAQYFLKEAVDISERSGMLHLHKLPYSLVEETNNRINLALLNHENTVRFDDLLESHKDEAVIYTPMRSLKTGDEFYIQIPLGEISPEGFKKAAKIYRSVLENSVVGHARKRLAYASESLQRAYDDMKDCEMYSDNKLNEFVSGIRSCNKDGECLEDHLSSRITYKDYCLRNVPNNIDIAKSWYKEAKDVLSKIESRQEKQNDKQIDAFTHSLLVDSMLRDWALPHPDAQEAFDYWRNVARQHVWKSIAQELDLQEIERKALSGGSLVFDVSIDDPMLTIRPLMSIDLKRSVVLFDKKLGVTVVANTWDFRQKQELKPVNIPDDKVLALLNSNPSEFYQRLKETPESMISILQKELLEEMPKDDKEWEQRTKISLEYDLAKIENELNTMLQGLESKSIDIENNSSWYKLQLLAYVAQSIPNVSPEFRLRVALFIARWIQNDMQQPVSADPWQYIDSAIDGTATQPYRFSLYQTLFGASPSDIVQRIIKNIKHDDQEYANTALKNRHIPKENSKIFINHKKTLDSPLPTLTYIVGSTNEVLDTLLLREQLIKATQAFNKADDNKVDGSVSARKLQSFLDGSQKLSKSTVGLFDMNSLSLNLRFAKQNSYSDTIGPVEGHDLYVELNKIINELGTTLRTSEKLISTMRFGRNQESLMARLMFERGAYSEALDRILPNTVPLSLYHPNMVWTVLNTSLRGIPNSVTTREDRKSVIISVTLQDKDIDVLRLDNLPDEAREELLKKPPHSVFPWNEGDLLWEQILTTVVSAPKAMKKAHAVLNENEELRLAVLKALVYSCSVPAQYLVEPSGRCLSVDGSTVLHDRVSDSNAIQFVTPSIDELPALAHAHFISVK